MIATLIIWYRLYIDLFGFEKKMLFNFVVILVEKTTDSIELVTTPSSTSTPLTQKSETAPTYATSVSPTLNTKTTSNKIPLPPLKSTTTNVPGIHTIIFTVLAILITGGVCVICIQRNYDRLSQVHTDTQEDGESIQLTRIETDNSDEPLNSDAEDAN